jgi:hypothetical protein
MFVQLLLTLCASHAAPLVFATPESGAAVGRVQDHKAEFEQRMKEAAGSVDKLWKLYEWCQSVSLDSQARQTLRAILKIDENDKRAHELLGEVLYEGKWFASEKKVEEYKRKQLEDEAKKTGKAIFNGQLVDPADVPYLERGLTKLPSGEWVNAEDQKKIAEGWVRQDTELVPPAEADNIAKGLWKCGDQWLALADADKYHAEYAQRWKIPSGHFVLHTTCARETAKKVLYESEEARKLVDRVLGRTPAGPVMLVVLRSLEQYNDFANSKLDGNAELTGFSSLHGAFFAEILGSALNQGFAGAGVACWDASDNKQSQWAPMFVRYAAAHALVEALDPSPKALASLAGNTQEKNPARVYWSEKQLPEWLRYGIAGYADAMRRDTDSKDPEQLRKFAIGHYIANRGGFDPLEKVFAMELTLDDQPNSEKLIFEAGLVVAFIIDGKCAPVVEKHAAFKDALKSGKDVKKAAQALETAITKNDDAWRKFAGI